MLKKITKIVILLFLCFALLPGLAVDANAAKKKKAVTPEEQQLAALESYRSALVKMGGTPEQLAAADQAVENQKAIIASQAAAAAAQAEYEKALAAQQAAALKAQKEYEAMVKKMMKGKTPMATGVIFVGDSRFCEMRGVMSAYGGTYVAQYAMGYQWFVDEAIGRIDPLVVPGTKIVINLGVNDPDNINNYLTKVNNKAAEWMMKGARVYYATINPVWDNQYISNEQVKNFNNHLRMGLNPAISIIDTNTYLQLTGYTMKDDFHYDAATYSKIYYYIMSQL